MLYGRILLFIHSKCNSLHLLTPNSPSTPLLPPFPLGNHKSVLYVCESVSNSNYLKSLNIQSLFTFPCLIIFFSCSLFESSFKDVVSFVNWPQLSHLFQQYFNAIHTSFHQTLKSVAFKLTSGCFFLYCSGVCCTACLKLWVGSDRHYI